jgi:hypothetical protein
MGRTRSSDGATIADLLGSALPGHVISRARIDAHMPM